ncbi:MAG: M23 family metallopeptidase [Cytophagales bacterium]|jgi:murein DD-endopeptidase MepM/ murein hydrolase activator NlpD|nr:M23 family metallopeptidase [Cytophagales bacterium]MCA6387919.1 M23 family metallopeptidase [Cytophagales bacterium]MCA6390999.1 M23 family metallopeptidase [Cytophagales bacterium]MCA6396943.1 M23 family metallopeptidase [Cytophagales bacterium]MCA6398325.1 M23 family metallopeptidase [Cytophagales bacterium]
MARIKYYYDTETCKYERIKTTSGDIFLNALGLLSLTLAMAVGLVVLYSNYFESPRELLLSNEVKEMEYLYQNLSKEVNKLDNELAYLEHRDDNIYRAVLGAEPIDKSVREAGVGGVDRYEDIKKKDLVHEDFIIKLHERVDKLKRKVYIESKSQDDVIALAENKEKLFAAIPAIQPVANKELIALASGFGMRIHPVYKVRKMHTGVDFAAAIGTPIYATADGIIDKLEVSFSGYGKQLEIDHGFGYRTRFAHMHGFAVRFGQKVKRGDLIGYVGETGLSTAPHLHYEVFVNGIHVNPIHYFFNDLNAKEYEKIIELASIENQSLGM